jgi:hypothetical protein
MDKTITLTQAELLQLIDAYFSGDDVEPLWEEMDQRARDAWGDEWVDNLSEEV